MRSKAIFMALLVFAFRAQGASVSRETAELAACGWAQNGAALGACIGSSVESSAEHATTNGAVFYSVKMYGGGTVFMASDTEIEPVIAFTDSAKDFSEIDPKSPLWALLNRDLSARRAAIDATPVVMRPRSALLAAGSEPAAAEGDSSIADKWAALVRRGEEASYSIKRLLSAAAPRQYAPGDLRVPARMTSTWDQADAGGGYHNSDSASCYNYYTPQDATGEIKEGRKENAVCGCVATAMGQVMFYHGYPYAATVPGEPDTCWFGTTELKGDKALSVSGDPYDWANMVGSPTEDSSDDVRKAIGRLTADAGISVGMHYTADDSGSYTFKASKALVDVFGYGQSVYADFENRSGTTVGSLTSSKHRLGKVVFSNLDAGYPVIFGIENASSGHEICADGYGYNSGVPYVHLNMGWSGECNVWYNLPNIDTRPGASFVFTAVSDAAYNIIPDGEGLGVMSGRVVDEDGDPIAAASVSVYDAGTDALVTQLVTTAYGVWGAALPEGSYNIAVSDSGTERSGGLFGVELRAPVQDDVEYQWRSPTEAIEKGDYPAVKTASDLGNSWGNDVTLAYPRVRIVVGSETNIYSSLDTAIAGARDIAAASGATPELEILRAVDLNNDATIDFSCIVRAATGDLSSTLVNRPSGATLTIAPGAELWVSNCVFQTRGRVPIVAGVGGRVFVGPGFAAERVAVADAGGFNVIGFVTSDLAVECTEASGVGLVFGSAVTDDPEALEGSVTRLYATFDADKAVRGTVQNLYPGVYNLVWAGVPVPVESSAGYYVTAAGATNTQATVDKLFAAFDRALEDGLFGPSPEIVLVGHDENGLSRDIVVKGPLVIRGEGGARLSAVRSHIFVENGGSLVVTDVAIDGGSRSDSDTFVRVKNGGSMTLGDGASLANFNCTGNADNLEAGPVYVTNGVLRLELGSEIAGCSASGSSSGCMYGGGVCVAGGGTLDLAGGAIHDCTSRYGKGGGVYAKPGANIVVSGPSAVYDNKSKVGDDDIYFSSWNDRITVVDSAAGGYIGVNYSSKGCQPGFKFATAEALSSAHDIEATAAAFFNDAKAARKAKVSGTDIIWGESEDGAAGPQPIDPTDEEAMALAVAKVKYPDGSTKFWKSMQDAFSSLGDCAADDEATVTLLKDDWFDEDVEVVCRVTLVSDGAAPLAVTRNADVSVNVSAGAALTVENVEFVGAVLPIEDVSQFARNPLFHVVGGSLVLDAAKVGDVYASGRFGAAVTVDDGGSFTMRNGSSVVDCMNVYLYDFDRTSYAAAIFANNDSTVVLEDCTVSNCRANRVGGVCVANHSTLYISGAADVSGNASILGDDANVTVSTDSSLVMSGAFSGAAGVRRDVYADLVAFGTVDDGFAGSDAALVSGAMKFTSDDGWGYGVAVRSDSGKTLLAWSERLGEDGTYVDRDGVEYSLVSDPSVPFPVAPPTAVQGLVYNGMEQVGVAGGFGYSLENASATASGDYVATATLAEGCVWTDDTTAPKDVAWSIAKATFDMSGVTFSDKTYVYDGEAKRMSVDGDLPDGVTVSFYYYSETLGQYNEGDGWSQPGKYDVTARFSFEGDSYEAIPDKVATMTIVRAVAAPVARTDLVYDATEQTGVEDGDGYTLSGEVSGTDAGTDYVAVAVLDDFMVWPDGTTNDLEVVWSIDPAPLTVSPSYAWKLVGEADPAALPYVVSGLIGDDTAADVLVGALVRDPGENTGAYAIRQGTLAVRQDNPNYSIASCELEFFHILTEAPGPEPGPESVDPLPVAFTAVMDDSGTWTLTITTAVEKCWYSLYETNSLSGGFNIDDVLPVDIRQATAGDAPAMNFVRPTNGSQLFWKIRAEPSNAH